MNIFHNRLIDRGKAYKGAVTTVMCMLVIPTNVLIFDEQTADSVFF